MENITVIGTIKKKKLETGKTEKGSDWLILGTAKNDHS